MFKQVVLVALLASVCIAYQSEFIQKAERRPTVYEENFDLPAAYTWGDINGVNFLTKSQNQHIPQYCGSCWCFGATSAFSDRVKIARGVENNYDFFLSVQYILNCGSTAGSCYGGDHLSVYEYAQGKAWPLDTAAPYIACSSDSSEGFCSYVDTSCNALNTARTCGTFGEACVGLDHYPNATVKDYGSVSGASQMQQEIYKNGPIACGIDAAEILDYHGGIFDNSSAGKDVDHIISVVGWGQDEETNKQYWIVRNSWGEYWGELGYIRVTMGDNQLGLESDCAWATVEDFTILNYPCDESGDNCKA